MKVIIIGATGFIGKELVKVLNAAGHNAVGTSRNKLKAMEILGHGTDILEWDGISAASLANHLEGFDAIINLAGESIASKRWTTKRKNIIYNSRVTTSKILTEAIRMVGSRPFILIQGSAIGYYGSPVDEPVDETHPAGKGFIAELTRDWEMAVLPASELVDRLVIIRTGLVLGNNGALLKKMLLPYRFGFGAVSGPGNQWMSWIHISDYINIIQFLLEKESCSGIYNLTAPCPVRMKDFTRTIGKVLRRPARIIIPGFIFRAGLGKLAEETVLASQNILPGRLIREGYQFRYGNLEIALSDLLKR